MNLQKWAQWAEIVASFAVVVTLVVLVVEVRDNTRALERQADLDRAAAATESFFRAPQLSAVLAKIKQVDGNDPFPAALMERYGLSPGEAYLWTRQIQVMWLGYEADFERSGPTPELEGWVGGMLTTPDNRLYFETTAPTMGAGFRAFVEGVVERSAS